MRDNAETNPNIIEARYRSSHDQALLNIELALANEAETSGGTGSTGASATGTVLTGIAGGIIRPPRCFIGSTLFSMCDDTQIEFQALYLERDYYIGLCAKSYDEQDNVVLGKILNVTKTIAYEYLLVNFGDWQRSGVKGAHRYYVGNGIYRPIKELKGKNVYSGKEKVSVLSYETIKVPKGIEMFNAEIETYQNYEADGKRVHNLKDPDDE